MPGECVTAGLRFGQESTSNSWRDRKNRVPRTSRSGKWPWTWVGRALDQESEDLNLNPGFMSCWSHELERNFLKMSLQEHTSCHFPALNPPVVPPGSESQHLSPDCSQQDGMLSLLTSWNSRVLPCASHVDCLSLNSARTVLFPHGLTSFSSLLRCNWLSWPPPILKTSMPHHHHHFFSEFFTALTVTWRCITHLFVSLYSAVPTRRRVKPHQHVYILGLLLHLYYLKQFLPQVFSSSGVDMLIIILWVTGFYSVMGKRRAKRSHRVHAFCKF